MNSVNDNNTQNNTEKNKKFTVMIVDDSTSVRFALKDHLQKKGYKVVEAEDGKQAVEKIGLFKPDIITMDVSMPEMDGFAACAAIHQLDQYSHTPIIFVTSNDTMEDRERGFQLGALEFISKRSQNFWLNVYSAIERILWPKSRLHNLTALVIDANSVTRHVLRSCLEQQGMQVLTANNENQARSIASQEKSLDIIITEVAESGINGVELCRHFRSESKFKEIPIILMCLEESRGKILNFFQAGATDYIIKPCPREELVARLLSHLETQRLFKDLANEVLKNKLVLDSAGEGIIGLNTDGEITFMNPAACTMLDSSLDELHGKCLHTLFHHSDIKKNAIPIEDSPFYKTYTSGETVHVNDDVFWLKDKTLPVKYVSCPLITDNQITGTVITFNNISAQKEDEALKRDVEQITRHDLKSPLNGIIGIPAMLIKDDNLNEKQKKFLAMLEESGHRMLHIINNSLNLYKMEKSTYNFSPEPVNVLSSLDKAISDISFIKGNNNEVIITINNKPRTTDQTFIIKGDKLLCYSMLTNLLKNACESSPYGSNIRIDLLSGNPFNEIRINNLGTVPEEIRDTFFDKYVTAGKSTGTGLGSYSAKLITLTQKGEISMESSDAKGTTLIIRLPS